MSESADALLQRRGIAYGLGAYLTWGLLPFYMRMMREVPAGQIVAHRALWTAALTVLLVVALRRGGRLLAGLRRPRVLPLLMASTLLIGINWMAYAWAVLNGHVLEGSLGYFINPLVNVALGVLVLKERLNRLERWAIALAAIGVAALAIEGGATLWLPVTLALSFGFYGLIRKTTAIDPLEGLAVETTMLAPIALLFLFWTAEQGQLLFGDDAIVDALLLSSGVVAAVPLLLFAAAARRMRYSALGVLQYVAPTMQFLQAVLLFGEKVTAVHAFTFACIWSALALYAVNIVRGERFARAARLT